MKKINLIIGALFFLTLVTAQLVGEITLAVITILEPIDTRVFENITFKIDGKEFSCQLSEPKGIIDDDDIENGCNQNIGELKDITDSSGRKYEEVTLGDTTYRSFDRAYLKKLKEDYEKLEALK